jgi:hypothetical protein
VIRNGSLSETMEADGEIKTGIGNNEKRLGTGIQERGAVGWQRI